MKAYFTASLRGKKKFIENYRKIVEQIEAQGYKMLSNHVLRETPKIVLAKTHEEVLDFYTKFLKLVSSADVVVAESSCHSTNVGHEVSVALGKGKPAIVLYTKSNEPRFLTANPSDKLLVYEYDMNSLAKTLRDALKEAKDQMDVRFNFFVSPKIVHYLDWIAKERKMPRAVYLRRLIGADMKKNKEYLKEA